LPVRIAGFMPGISSPGGPSHQAIEDVALMRAIPNMTVIDLADACEIRQCVDAIVDLPGPVYLRLKRGEIPIIFDDDHRLDLEHASVLYQGDDVAVIANGMMLAPALAAREILEGSGLAVSVLNAPVIKPFDHSTVASVLSRVPAVVTAENHSVVGGLGSAVAEVIAESGTACTLRRVGLQDTFAEGSRTAPYLFEKYGLTTQTIINAAWQALARVDAPPQAEAEQTEAGEYAPV
jgi:transketolase